VLALDVFTLEKGMRQRWVGIDDHDFQAHHWESRLARGSRGEHQHGCFVTVFDTELVCFDTDGGEPARTNTTSGGSVGGGDGGCNVR
jgi:hypothetical protein